jgi:hypothetical protein
VKHSRNLIALAAALFTLGAASAQSFQTPGSKIAVSGCAPHQHTVGQSHPWIDPYGHWHYDPARFPYWDAFLSISYENKAAVVATEVEFGLLVGGSLVAVVTDVGKFSPDVRIDHEFVVSREIFPLAGEPFCSVLRVKYADGSTWQSEAPHP